MLTELEVTEYIDLKENCISHWDAKRMYELRERMSEVQFREMVEGM